MACLTNSGILLGCDAASVPGLKSVWITNLSNVDADEIEYDADGVISGLTTAISGGTIFYKYESTKQTANFSEEAVIDVTNASFGYNQRLVMRFPKQDKDKRNEMKYLVQSLTVAIIEDFNGKYRMVAIDNGMTPEVMNDATGAALGEGNIYDVTLLGQESDLAPFILDKTVFEAFI